MKKALYNKKNKKQLLQDIAKENFNRVTISFYKYVELDDLGKLRDTLYYQWKKIKD